MSIAFRFIGDYNVNKWSPETDSAQEMAEKLRQVKPPFKFKISSRNFIVVQSSSCRTCTYKSRPHSRFFCSWMWVLDSFALKLKFQHWPGLCWGKYQILPKHYAQTQISQGRSPRCSGLRCDYFHVVLDSAKTIFTVSWTWLRRSSLCPGQRWDNLCVAWEGSK